MLQKRNLYSSAIVSTRAGGQHRENAAGGAQRENRTPGRGGAQRAVVGCGARRVLQRPQRALRRLELSHGCGEAEDAGALRVSFEAAAVRGVGVQVDI